MTDLTRQRRRATSLWWVTAFLPLVALAAPTARQELREALRTRPNIERGQELFTPCAGCHGAQGGGRTDGAAPRIAAQHREVIIQQLVDFRHGRRWDHRMERFASDHNLADAQAIADVAEYVSRLEAPSSVGVGSGELIGHGAAVYANLCASCHGVAAEGNARTRSPQLAAQHYEYLLRQMYDAVERRRPNFSKSHIRLLEKFILRDFQGVADYLSRLPIPEAKEVSNVQAHSRH